MAGGGGSCTDSPPHSLQSFLVLERRKDHVCATTHVARHHQAISSRTRTALLFSALLVPKESPDQFATREEERETEGVCACACSRLHVCLGISIKDGSVARDEGARRQIHTF